MKTIILNFTFLLFGASLFAQNTWTVDNRPGTTAQFTSIQAAIDAASEGDFIYVHPSPNTYDNITIKKEIHLRGIGHGPELANGENAKIGIITLFTDNASLSASSSSISGLEIVTGINDNNFGAISNVLIQNNKIGFISIRSPFNFIIQGNLFINTGLVNVNSLAINNANHGNLIISHNFFVRNTNGASIGVVSGLIASDTFNNNIMVFNNDKIAFNACNNPVVNNNIFLFTTANNTSTSVSSINDVNNTPITYQNCLTFAYGGQTITTLNGTNNLNNTNPQFTDIGNPENPVFAYTKNYKLKVGSPAIGAGSDNSDLGIYGQGFLFQMKGYPFDLPYPTNININNAIVEAGSNLQVVLKANANVEN